MIDPLPASHHTSAMRLSMIATGFCMVLLSACTYGGDGGSGSSSSLSVSSVHPLLSVTQPSPNTTVSSPLTVTGEARGYWYFEASFPVRLLDGNGLEIAVAPAQALGEWMTEDFVPFSVVLNFAPPTTSTGTLILEKDNPSGEPANDDSIHIPVLF